MLNTDFDFGEKGVEAVEEQLRNIAALPTLSEDTVRVPPLPVLNTCFSGPFAKSIPVPYIMDDDFC